MAVMRGEQKGVRSVGKSYKHPRSFDLSLSQMSEHVFREDR